ncbi:MAG: sec-independent translocase [Actinomycetes bacterium]
MFGIGTGELIALAVLALLVLGPDKLPRFAADAGRFVRQVRRMADTARDDVRRELGPEFADIDISDLDPKSFVRKHVLDPDELGLDDLDGEKQRRRGSASAKGRGTANGEHVAGPAPAIGEHVTEPATPPYDPDTT